MQVIKKYIPVVLWLLIILLVQIYPSYSEEKLANPREDKITINFVDVEITTVVDFISKLTSKNFIYDDRLKGKITIVAPSKINVDEAFDLFISVLQLKGYSTVLSGSAYKIIPSGEIKQGPIEVFHEVKDVRVNESYIARVVPLAHTQAKDVMPMLQPLISREGYISVFGKGNSLLVIDNALNIEKILSIVKLLDIESLPEISSKINVHYLENAEAVEIAKVLEGLTRQIPSAAGIQAQPATSELSGKILIMPDKATNSLVIMSLPEDYRNLVQIIKKLDRRPRQVFVEAMITEVSINKLLDLGTKWRIAATKDGKPVALGGIGTIDTSAIGNIISGMAGLTIGGVGNFLTVPVTRSDGSTFNLTAPGFAALFNLQDFKGAIDVLSTPQILTSDNKEAEIVVGENVPFLSKLEREATATNQPILQSIERKDVGITLKIKPQISEGNYVKVDIYQEISALAPTAATEGLAITTKRSAKTSVVVKDKQTIVIGGLIQDKETRSITKIPLLGDIPFLGWFFKYSSTEKQKTNLMIYLTPTIINELSDLDEVKQKSEEKFKDHVLTNQATENENKSTDNGISEQPKE